MTRVSQRASFPSYFWEILILGSSATCAGDTLWHPFTPPAPRPRLILVPLVIKEPVRLSAEEPLEVESHRSRGSASSTKKHFFSEGEGSTVRTAASGGLGLGAGLSGLGLTGSASLSTSIFGEKKEREN